MEEDFFVFLSPADAAGIKRRGFVTTRHIRTKESAQKAIDQGVAVPLYRLIPVSVSEEPVTVMKKVIP